MAKLLLELMCFFITFSALTSLPQPDTELVSYAKGFHAPIWMVLCHTFFNITRLSPLEFTILQNSPGYLSSIRDVPVIAHTTHKSRFLGLRLTTGAWPSSNFGKDVIIGLVDSGIWPESESFSDVGMGEVPARCKGRCVEGTGFNYSMCNKKLIGARFFNKGLLSNKPNVTVLMNSTRDTDGHGTHTSSTAAGNYVKGASFFGYAKGTARGMAPRSHLAMYKVLWDAGAYASDVIAAIDQAIVDGVDVISLSFGLGGVPLCEDPVARASFAATEKGIFVGSSAGNEGPWFGTVHNGIPWILNVAADKKEFVGIQVKNAAASRVAGGVFISNSSYLEFFVETSFAALFLHLQEGQAVIGYIKKTSNPTASMQFKLTQVGGKPAPKHHGLKTSPVTDFGANDLFGEFNIITGTSMACPHAAGVAAILKASPLAMGAGHINPNKALDPGLIYDATTEDYVKLLCGMNYSAEQIQMITKSSSYKCSNPSSLDLNYPSFIAFFNATDASLGKKLVHNFQRTVTNVGDRKAHYTAKVAPITGFKVNVVPNRLIFEHKYEKRSYKLSIEGPKVMKELVVHGSLSWVDAEGRHVVRSPVVVTRVKP
ncbi:hypothetical protein Patl1_28679 [Pistacia atlantica]|uniref:Uncharacterized protein n=1 Tax=Pistacia atlantica TaxID=434234 RepID=A0ACC1BFW7_9ROSI|nr:hypothetical protein Patl1_28679 [Pistacia atlantica]